MLEDTVSLTCGLTLRWWKLKIHMEQRNLSKKTPGFVLPTLFSKLQTQISPASQDVDADLQRGSAVNSTGFWRCIPALPILHLLPDPPQGKTLGQAHAAFRGLRLFLYSQKPLL